MPVVIDATLERDIENKDYENGVPLELTPEQRKTVVLTKYISTISDRADWQPDKEWIEEFTADIARGRRTARILVPVEGGEEDETRALNIDDGCIVRLCGTFSRTVGILAGRPPMGEDEVQAHIDATDEPVPLYQQWDFRVKTILKTNGPEARWNIQKSEDQKRANSQAEMFDAFKAMFQLGTAEMAKGGEVAPTAEQAIKAGMEKAAKGK